MVSPLNSTRKSYGSFWASLGIIVAIFSVYQNSYFGPFVFDDIPAILENPTIHSLLDFRQVLSPPHGKGITVEGRPLVNLSLALNYAISGTEVWSYHLLNLIIHSSASLFVLGIVRRTLLRLRGLGLHTSEALGLGFSVALMWALHPLQTESVTYVIQRAESLMGLFYLASLYCFIRGTETKQSAGWIISSVAACLAGMASKEVMISAPLIILVYDWIINELSLKDALKKRSLYYLALTVSACVLLFLALGTGTRGGTSGFGIDISPWTYWKTQFEAMWHYLALVFWPKNLVFDYGVQWVEHFVTIIPYVLFLMSLVVVSAYYLVKRSWIGLLALFFFAILAPTSVMPGNRQILAEHRMYLPLLSVISLLVCGGYFLLRRSFQKISLKLIIVIALILSAALGLRSYARNQDYSTVIGLYQDTVLKRPQNGYAHYNLGKLLAESGKLQEAISEYQAAIKYGPNTEQAHYNLGNTFTDLNRYDEAIAEFEAAIKQNPMYSKAHYNLGNVLVGLGRLNEALVEFTTAAHLKPNFLEAQDNRGGVLLELGRYPEAEEQFLTVITKNPMIVDAHINLGNTYRLEGKLKESIEQFEIALRLDPRCVPAQKGLTDVRALLDGAPRL